MPKGAWKEYFVFSKRERVAVFVLLTLMAAFMSLSFFYTPVFEAPVIDQAVQQKLTQLAQNNTKDSPTAGTDNDSSGNTHIPERPKHSAAKKEQFYFDPNTISIDGWKRLGFRDKTIANILHYRNQVGKFNKPEDLYNVPRIRKKAVAAILPFVRFGAVYAQKNDLVPQHPAVAPLTVKAHYKTIDVNAATPDDFKAFPGMTDAVANRIVKFRASINGFSSVDDVAKTYGLHDSTFKIMRPYLSISPK